MIGLSAAIELWRTRILYHAINRAKLRTYNGLLFNHLTTGSVWLLALRAYETVWPICRIRINVISRYPGCRSTRVGSYDNRIETIVLNYEV